MASDEFMTLVDLIKANFAPMSDANLSAAELRGGMELVAGVVPPVDGTTVEPIDVGGVPCEWIRPSTAVAPDTCVLYLHGGGYVIGSCNTHRAVASHLAERTGLPILVVDYRLAPEHVHPAALDDALIAYEWLLGQGFAADRIVVAGDSAGGGLTLAMLLALRDGGRPLPALGVPISPWTDLTLSGATITSMAEHDPMVSRVGLQRMADWYVAGGDAAAPLVSPLFADPTGLPPLLIHVGEVEILRDDAVGFAERAKNAGVDVTLEVWPEMIHVWHVFGPGVPESEAGVVRIAEFISQRLGLSSPAMA